jgi:hypothetical protein
MRKKVLLFCGWKFGLLSCLLLLGLFAQASSHREAPLISNDPLADNTDVYAFRCPDDPDFVTIIANYIPFESPDGGPNYYTFGNNIRYEINIKNRADTPGPDIIYRFRFQTMNEDPYTFFRIRLGKENWKTTYSLVRSVDGGKTFDTVIRNGYVPPPNIGPRSIESPVGLNTNYNTLMQQGIMTTADNEKVFCGPVDDPFFVDLAGAFDLANFRKEGNPVNPPKDGLARFNVHSIALKIPIAHLQKAGKPASAAISILDPDYVIGVWASASRPELRTIGSNYYGYSGHWRQVSRLGMPLTNEVIIPLRLKDKWNTISSGLADRQFEPYLVNPEVALYMDDARFGGAIPALCDLRIQTKSLGQFDFRDSMPGLYPLKGSPALNGTALADAAFGDYLLRPNAPRSVDLLPIFHTGVPNLPPYQLATGKAGGNPLAPGKPFINNFLPTFGDMLRLNMAVPPTPRNSPDFSSEGLIATCALGLLDPRFNQNTNLQFIPNMDGFPNGRRLEDDVTRIELQAASGIVLAALGLWYDDFTPGTTPSPVTPRLLRVVNFTAGPTHNDTTFKAAFPYVQTPWRGFDFTMQPRF